MARSINSRTMPHGARIDASEPADDDAAVHPPAKVEGNLPPPDLDALKRLVWRAHESSDLFEHQDRSGRDWTIQQQRANNEAVINVQLHVKPTFQVYQRNLSMSAFATVHADTHIHNMLQGLDEEQRSRRPLRGEKF